MRLRERDRQRRLRERDRRRIDTVSLYAALAELLRARGATIHIVFHVDDACVDLNVSFFEPTTPRAVYCSPERVASSTRGRSVSPSVHGCTLCSDSGNPCIGGCLPKIHSTAFEVVRAIAGRNLEPVSNRRVAAGPTIVPGYVYRREHLQLVRVEQVDNLIAVIGPSEAFVVERKLDFVDYPPESPPRAIPFHVDISS